MTTEAYFNNEEKNEVDELIDMMKNLTEDDRKALAASANAYKLRNEIVGQQETA